MLIQVKNLGHNFAHKLFEKISLDIEIGDFCAIYGPS